MRSAFCPPFCPSRQRASTRPEGSSSATAPITPIGIFSMSPALSARTA